MRHTHQEKFTDKGEHGSYTIYAVFNMQDDRVKDLRFKLGGDWTDVTDAMNARGDLDKWKGKLKRRLEKKFESVEV